MLFIFILHWSKETIYIDMLGNDAGKAETLRERINELIVVNCKKK